LNCSAAGTNNVLILLNLWKLFQHGGGEVVSTPGDHGITLIPPEVDLIGNDEVYSTEYIKECCTRNRLLDLKPYRFEFCCNEKVVYEFPFVFHL
jgi:hypothetical protein